MENTKKSTETSAATPDVDRTPVAKEIWCYSTKEKTDTWHVVVNHDSKGFVDRVQCKTSGVIHKYKKQNKETAAKPTRVVRRKSSVPMIDWEERWFAGIKAWGNKALKDYVTSGHFKVGEVVNHSTFGKGIITGRRENKIDILFQTGMKTLISPDAPK